MTRTRRYQSGQQILQTIYQSDDQNKKILVGTIESFRQEDIVRQDLLESLAIKKKLLDKTYQSPQQSRRSPHARPSKLRANGQSCSQCRQCISALQDSNFLFSDHQCNHAIMHSKMACGHSYRLWNGHFWLTRYYWRA